MRPSLPPLAVIAGPTASGKSALALELAQRSGGVIVNADSAQIYRDLPILSASPSPEELSQAEHRLYGVLDGSTACSAADWAAMARREVEEIQGSGRLPILVGGTGLYLRTLLDGIAPVPRINPDVRAQVRQATVEENRRRLMEFDPQAAERLNANDSTRIGRALEVVLSTGRTLQQWQEAKAGGIAGNVELKPIILLPRRDWLYDRCDLRFARMIDSGGISEVERLLVRQLDPSLPVMRAIGVPEVRAFLSGDSNREEMIAAGQQATRNYAKRQYTWFAHQPPSEWPRFGQPLENSAIGEALTLLGG
ncbi:MAG: tRNA (adenosine(37)-N6)-dimethylallyltransferase MiaA [Sphingomicrobium sp.]